MEMLCFNSYRMHRVRNVVSAVLVYPSSSRRRVSVDPVRQDYTVVGRVCFDDYAYQRGYLVTFTHCVECCICCVSVLVYLRGRVSVDPV